LVSCCPLSRVAPIDAIQTGHLVAKGGGLTRLMHGIALPGKSFTQMPLRNLLRSPWRTLLTVLGIAVAIILMTVFVGFGDSFVATLDASNDAYLYQGSDRLLVNLDFFYPADNGEITALPSLTTTEGTPLFGAMDKSLIVGGRLLDGEDDINVRRRRTWGLTLAIRFGWSFHAARACWHSGWLRVICR